jgi:hypothetical protein
MANIWSAPLERNEEVWARGLAGMPTSYGDLFKAAGEEGLVRNPVPSLYRVVQRDSYFPHLVTDPMTGQEAWSGEVWEPAARPSRILSSEEAENRYGIPGELSFIGMGQVPELLAQELVELKRDEIARRDIMRRGPGGIGGFATQAAAGLLASLADPANIASSFIPIVSQARYLQALRNAAGAGGRFITRAGLGAAEGVAGAAVVEPVIYGAARQERADYGAVDSLVNLAFGGFLGGGLHSAGGAVGDRLGISAWARDTASEDRARTAVQLNRIEQDGRERATRSSVADLATGRRVNVEGTLDTEPTWRLGDPLPAEILEARRQAQAMASTMVDTPARQRDRDLWEGEAYGKGAAFKQMRADIVIGLPGSGKSSAITGNLKTAHGALEIDAERIKELIPEYRDGLGSLATQQEADEVARRVLARALINGDNIVLPITGNARESIEKRINALAQAGYDVHLHFVDLPVEKAVQRVITRFNRRRRFTDPDAVLAMGDNPRNNFEAFKNDPRVSSWSEFSNNVAEFTAAKRVGGQRRRDRRGADRSERPQTARASGEAIGGGYEGFPATAQAARAHTVTGTAIDVRLKVIELDQLVTSHTIELAENPLYPQALQPRERTRAASAEQIQKMAAELNPELLGPNPSAAEGAPIIGPDNVVESGNARVLAIARAYAQGLVGGDQYRSFLRGLGFNLTGLTNPVLVRERLTPLNPTERQRFALDANTPGVARFSAAEQARSDAQRMRQTALELLRPGDIENEANAPFRRAFADSLPVAERATLFDASGALSPEGRRRLEAAMLAIAYDDAQLLTRLVETRAEALGPIAGALNDVAGDWVRMRGEARAGRIIAETDTTQDLLAAVAMVDRARRENIAVQSIADQRGLFGDALTPQARGFLELFFEPPRPASPGKPAVEPLTRLRSRTAIAGELSRYIDQAMQTRPSPTLFSDTMPPMTTANILAAKHPNLAPMSEQPSAQAIDLEPGRTLERPAGAAPIAAAVERLEAAGRSLREEAAAATTRPDWIERQKARRKAAAEPARTEVKAQIVGGPAAELPAEVPATVFSGYGRPEKGSIYGTIQEPILGGGKYYAFSRQAAEYFGPQIEPLATSGFRNPLVIRSDDEFKALIRAAGWQFPIQSGLPAEQIAREQRAMNELIKRRGHDAVVITWDDLAQGDFDRYGHGIKTLRTAFGEPQIYVPGPARRAPEGGPRLAQERAQAGATGEDLAARVQAEADYAARQAELEAELAAVRKQIRADDPASLAELEALKDIDEQAGAERAGYDFAASCLTRGG